MPRLNAVPAIVAMYGWLLTRSIIGVALSMTGEKSGSKPDAAMVSLFQYSQAEATATARIATAYESLDVFTPPALTVEAGYYPRCGRTTLQAGT